MVKSKLSIELEKEEIAAVGGDRVADPSLISTIGGEVVSCAGASSLTIFAARLRWGKDGGGGRRSRRGSQPSPIFTIEGVVASYIGTSFQ
ncbi:hypothetical protein TIFTF001_007636 [Ficus carica]|uniref:Uncharacterized protein n=1 Tax=Ficus carica TaxID=3494 RepID=A0AA87ZS08_FICCA|nr:hypothetical protein TIFTF001_007636 [Ficus carica]